MLLLVVLTATLATGQAQVTLPQFVTRLGGKTENIKRIEGKPLKEVVKFRVSLNDTNISDQDMATLRRFPGILELNLAFTPITDAAIDHVAAMTDLECLDLTNTRVSDDGIAKLLNAPGIVLTRLEVGNARVSPRSIANLIQRFPDIDICRIAKGDKARYRVHENYKNGKLLYKHLMISDTYYGDQYINDPNAGSNFSRIPTTYYHRDGPVGQILNKFDLLGRDQKGSDNWSEARLPASLTTALAPQVGNSLSGLSTLWSEPAIAVIRMNAGTLAAYARPYQRIDFFNGTPELTALSIPSPGEEPAFSYLQDAQQRGAIIRVFDGDERTTFARRGPKKFYAAVFFDITRTDLRDINSALFTKEAIADFIGALTEDGVLCFHISHRYHDMSLPLVDAARALGLAWKNCRNKGSDPKAGESRSKHFSSEWLMIARKSAYLDHLKNTQSITWTGPPSTGQYLWTDGGRNDLDALKRDKGK